MRGLSRGKNGSPMLIAYLDEVGETGAFVSRSDSRYKTSPAFGYAGFILPEQAVRTFSREFHYEKHTLFADLIGENDPGTWEAKGPSFSERKRRQKTLKTCVFFDISFAG